MQRLERGAAYNTSDSVSADEPRESQWPTYRHDAHRSGATESTVGTELKNAWTAGLGTKPGGLTVADGHVLVAGVDAHTVFALRADTGKRAWSFTTGARVVSPPTFYRGTAIFGSNDGCVYCLRASDGQLVWRFHAAPRRQLVTAFEQLESAWPVPGVLVQDGTCWFAAGRSSYLDDGIFLYALDARTGDMVHEEVIYHPDPETGKSTPDPSAQELPGLLNDIPGSDGRNVFIRQMCVSSDAAGESRHAPVHVRWIS